MAKTITPHVIIVLKLPKPVPAFIIAATNIVDAMTANSKTFPSPSPALALVSPHIADLTAKEGVAKTRASGAVADRDAALTIVVGDLKSLRAYVETVANADPANAASIAKDASMSVRTQATRTKSDLAVKSVASGEVQVVAKAIAGGKAHEWEYSLDGKTWTDVPTTLQGKTTIKGLQVGVTTYFRHRVVTKAGVQDWGQPISAIVT
jgi:hypothetical protein